MLHKYRCSTCGKIWYEEKQSGYAEHGCPDGCNDAGEYLGYVEVTAVCEHMTLEYDEGCSINKI